LPYPSAARTSSMEIDLPDEHGRDPDSVGPPIHIGTRAQAIADGFQVKVTEISREAGIQFPVFLTRAFTMVASESVILR
jgi:hypothetical protein